MTKEDFFEAVADDNFLKVTLYIHAGANIDFRDDMGRPPLQIALEHGHVDLIAVLIDAGANPFRSNGQGEHILTWAVKYCNIEVFTDLLSKGFDVNKPDLNGDKPLDVASSHGYWEHVQVLLQHGADPLTGSDMSPGLLYRIFTSDDYLAHMNLIKLILENMDINKTDGDGNTILSYVVRSIGKKELVHLILKHKADPNILNNDGNTALHISILNLESRSCIGLLLGFGANPYQKNAAGRNAFDIMREKHEFRLLKLLEEYTQKYAERYKQYI